MATVLSKTWTWQHLQFTYTLAEASSNPNGGTYGTKTFTSKLTAKNTGSSIVDVNANYKLDNQGSTVFDSLTTSGGYAIEKTVAGGQTVTCFSRSVTINATAVAGTMPGVRVTIDYYTNESPTFKSATYSASVTAIDRKSQHSLSATTLNAGSAMTITIDKKVSAATHTLQYKLSSASSWTTIVTKTSATSYSWTPNASIMPNAKYGPVQVRCIAYQGSTVINTATDKAFTFNVPDNSTYRPSVSGLALTDDNGYLATFGVMLTGLSKPKLTWTESPKAGATIKSRSVTLGGTTYTPSSASVTGALVTNAGTVQATDLVVTDSRGLSSAAASSSSVSAIAYAAPSASASEIYRSNASGTASEEGTRIAVKPHFTKTSIGSTEKNFVTLKIYLGDELKTTLTETASSPISSNAVVLSDTISTEQGYTVSIEASDTVGKSSTYSVYIPPSIRVMSFKEDGTGVAFGKAASKSGFECEWDAVFNNAFGLGLNTSESSGEDHDLYAAITDLGWESEVIE
ncbi:MAG: hypothetical protein IJG15_01170 [Lachnospiraceae bacterium]|nr:hypothetical protein [Lachnospiraceae bacterium]